MSRAQLVLAFPTDRIKAHAWIDRAPVNTRVEFKAPRRSVPQNDLMWSRLTDVAQQLTWHGQKYSTDDWKDYFMHALRRARWMPDEDGGMVPIGLRTSDLSKEEMGDLLDLMDAFAARHGVVWSEPKSTGEGAGGGSEGAARTRQMEREKESA